MYPLCLSDAGMIQLRKRDAGVWRRKNAKNERFNVLLLDVYHMFAAVLEKSHHITTIMHESVGRSSLIGNLRNKSVCVRVCV